MAEPLPAPAPSPSLGPLVTQGQLTPEGTVVRDQGLAQFKAREDASAYQTWLPLAEAGHAETQYNLGVLLTQGGAVPRDEAAARRWHERAVQGDYGPAYCAMGDLLWADRSDPVNRQRAFSAYLRGAAKEELPCMHNTAAILLNGLAGARDLTAGLHWLERAATAGNVDSQFQLGSAHLHGTYGAPQHETARRWLTQAADQGHLDATHDLAYMWEQGLGAEQDLAQAAALYQRAAAGGQPRSANNLGLMYRNAQGVPRDHAQAVKLFQQSAALKNPDAMVNLGDMHYLGLGVPADPAAAGALYQQAANADLLWGDCRLAALLRHGEGMPVDVQRAQALQQRVKDRMPSADCTTPLSRLLR
jgi:TPR repeat protein